MKLEYDSSSYKRNMQQLQTKTSSLNYKVKSNIDRIEQDAILAQEAYNTIEKQRISALMEVQDAKPVFVVLEPASYPNKANSSRAVKVIIYALLGFILSSAWAIFGSQLRTTWKQDWSIIKNNKTTKDENN